MDNILFDFDGTLMDTWPGIERTILETLESLELEPAGHVVDRSLVGIPLVRVFEKLLGDNGPVAWEATLRYRELFPGVGLPAAGPFEGASEMLERLKKRGRSLYVVTARNEMITRRMIMEHGLADFITAVRGEKEGEVPDGKGHMVAEVLDRFSLDPGRTVMVGDRRYDMEAATANGVAALGVTYGYGSAEELVASGADRIAESISEVAAILLADYL
jgi:phosphoglycolate phosphatase